MTAPELMATKHQGAKYTVRCSLSLPINYHLLSNNCFVPMEAQRYFGR